MPFDVQFTEDYMGIIHVGTGIVTGSEILDACRSVTALVQTTENFHYKLVDLSGARELRVSADELHEIVEEDRLIAMERPHIAVAIVTPDEKMRAIAKHWETLVNDLGWTTHTAGTREKALDWLRENAAAQVEI